jgi:hypothetical protein
VGEGQDGLGLEERGEGGVDLEGVRGIDQSAEEGTGVAE